MDEGCKGCIHLDEDGETDLLTYPCGYCDVPERDSFYEQNNENKNIKK